MNKPLCTLFLGVALLSGTAMGSDIDDFTRLDTNQDGKLSEDEFAKLAADRGGRRSGSRSSEVDRFSQADKDGDGYLSPSEFSAARGNRGSRNRT